MGGTPMKGENTIRCETDNAKLLKRTHYLQAKENKHREI
jgi:hypothetical protein